MRVLLIIFLLPLLINVTFAADKLPILTGISGSDVKISHPDGTSTIAKNGDSVPSGSTVLTNNSNATLLYPDNSALKMQPGAEVIAEGKNAFDAYQQNGVAEITNTSGMNYDKLAQGGSSSTSNKIFTSEKVPGADCKCVAEGAQDNVPADGVGPVLPGKGEAACGDPTTRKYECTVQSGLKGFQNVFAQIIRYIVYTTMLLGVLAVVGLGIAWAWAGGEDVKMKSNLKHWAINVLVGLTILFLFRYILTFLAPWIFN